MTRALSISVVAGWAVLLLPAGCPVAPAPIVSSTEPCAADDVRVGQTAVLRTRFHGVSGTARIVDNCTIVLENFTYDGGGLDVRVYGSADGSFDDGVVLSGDLRRASGYRDETLTVRLPDGVTLDDVRHIAIWCIVVNENFGDGSFE